MSEERSAAPATGSGPDPGPFSSLRARLLVALLVAAAGPLLLAAGALYVVTRSTAGSAVAITAVLAAPLLTVAWLWLVDRAVRRRLIRPLARMSDGAERIAKGDHAHRLGTDGPAELARLARSINRMARILIRHQELLAENVRSLEQTNRSLVEARDDLVHAEKLASVGRLAAGLAHEIGNPLNSILAYADLARRRDADPAWVEGVREEAARIDEIITGLLDFARPREGAPEAVAPNAVVRDTHGLLEAQGQLRGIEVELRLDPSLPAARANRARLKQVLVNLMLNACDVLEGGSDRPARITVSTTAEPFARPGFVRVEPRRDDDPEAVDYSHLRRLAEPATEYRLPPFEEGEKVVALTVLDNGPGIEADPVRRVFEPFYTTKEPGRGTGLGLAVAARLVHEMGGWIDAGNRVEGGSAFTVYLACHGEEKET